MVVTPTVIDYSGRSMVVTPTVIDYRGRSMVVTPTVIDYRGRSMVVTPTVILIILTLINMTVKLASFSYLNIIVFVYGISTYTYCARFFPF